MQMKETEQGTIIQWKNN